MQKITRRRLAITYSQVYQGIFCSNWLNLHLERFRVDFDIARRFFSVPQDDASKAGWDLGVPELLAVLPGTLGGPW